MLPKIVRNADLYGWQGDPLLNCSGMQTILIAKPADWMPWNYRLALERSSSSSC